MAVITAAFFIAVKRAVARELMDDQIDSLDELCANLREIEKINRLFGSTADLTRIVGAIAARNVLDVASGLGDIALSLAQAQPDLRLTCLDRSAQMLALARERTLGHPQLQFVCADAMALPFADGAFDVAMCNLALHHFEPPQAVRMLAELRRVARGLAVVTDLRRSALGYIGARVIIGSFSRNRLTRHDGPLSVRRAYTPDEARALAAAAGWYAPRVRTRPFFRMILQDG